MAHRFKGKDRRMIQKTRQLLNTIIARDTRAQDDRPTSALSTRFPILDYNEGENGLKAAAQLLITALTADLAAG